MNILVHSGMLFPADGQRSFQGDLYIRDGIIAELSHHIDAPADMVMDASGMCVTPGFIDIHRHPDLAALARGFGFAELAQGITTVIGSNCGLSPVPMSAETAQEAWAFLQPCLGEADGRVFESFPSYLKALEASSPRVNMGMHAAFGAIRICTKGFDRSPFSSAEIGHARALLREAMETGAAGVSLGVMYPPECYTTAEEYEHILSAAAPYGRPLCCHVRGEGASLVASIREVLDIAGRAGLPLHISHFKSTGRANWQREIHKAIDLIESARAKGRDVTVDFYPYTAGASTLLSLAPPWVLKDDRAQLWRELAAPEGKERMRSALYLQQDHWDNMVQDIGWSRITLCSVQGLEAYAGLDMATVAKRMGFGDPSDAMCEILVLSQGKAGVVLHSMCEEDVRTIAQLPYSFLISDALYGPGAAHPRQKGAFPAFLQQFVPQVLSFEEAICKMTSMPARRLGLKDIGMLKPGMRADVNIFAPHTFRANADYLTPDLLASGMHAVLINGRAAWENENVTNETAGRIVLVRP